MDDDNTLSTEEQATLDQMRADEAAETPEQPEAAAPEAEAPTEAPAAEETPPAEGERQKTVPHAALHEERERRKETERRLAEAEQRSRTLEERTNLILQRFAPPQQQDQPAPLPDREKDPVGYLEARAQRAEEAAAAALQALNQRGQQDQHAQAIAAIQRHATAAEMQFRQSNPDYDAAVAHLVSARHRQLEIAGWANPADRQAVITQEAVGLAGRALQERRNPAEIIYGLAKEFGYTPPQPGGQQQPSTPATEERLAQISRGQQQSRSLGSVRGGAPPALTAQRLAEMPEEEFNKIYDTAAGRALRGA